MKILVTGAAGFIGFHVTQRLLEKGYEVVGLDNINGYYDIKLKFSRLEQLGITQADASPFNILSQGNTYGSRFRFVRMDLENRERIPKLFRRERFDIVCHLAAQAGVRYSIENPEVYIDSNLVGFSNILEACRHHSIEHLVYASSSSVYGLNSEMPFKTSDKTNTPISLYAATKIGNELMAHVYSHLFQLPTTGLRFFTVYGPWGRPDMALFKFTKAILHEEPIKVFNEGKMERDFTYIEDIAQGVTNVIEKGLEERKKNGAFYKTYNIGNNQSLKLLDFITALEKVLNKKAKMEMLPLQKGDVVKTWADIEDFKEDYGYNPDTPIEQGISEFVNWYKKYYKIPI